MPYPAFGAGSVHYETSRIYTKRTTKLFDYCCRAGTFSKFKFKDSSREEGWIWFQAELSRAVIRGYVNANVLVTISNEQQVTFNCYSYDWIFEDADVEAGRRFFTNLESFI